MSVEIEVDEVQLINDITTRMKTQYVERTAKRYSSSAKLWLFYLAGKDISIFDAKKGNLRTMLGEMRDYYSDSHIYGQKCGVGAVYQILKQMEADGKELPAIPENPNEGLSIEKMGLNPEEPTKANLLVNKDRFLDPEQVEKLIEHVPEPRARNKFVIKLLYRTMVRPSELCNIRLSQIDRDNKEILIPSQKSKKSRTVYYMGNDVPLLMDTWWDVDRKAMNPHKESPYLFITNRSEQLSYQMLNQIVKRAAENADMQTKLYTDGSGNDRWWITSHIFRHSGAMRYIQRGMDIGYLSEILGHDKADTTKEKYLHLLDSDKREKARVLWNAEPVKEV